MDDEERLKNYIFYNQILVERYQDLGRKHFDLSSYLFTFIMGFLTIIITITISLDILIQDSKHNIVFLVISIFPSLIVFIANLYFFTQRYKTIFNAEHAENPTLWFHKNLIAQKNGFEVDWKPFEDKFNSVINIDESNNQEVKSLESQKKALYDGKIKLYQLLCYQKRVYLIQIKMRNFYTLQVTAVFFSIMCLIISFIIIDSRLALISFSLFPKVLTLGFCIYIIFKRKKYFFIKKDKDSIEILLNFTKEEYKIIQEKAKSENNKIKEYCKSSILNYSNLEHHEKC